MTESVSVTTEWFFADYLAYIRWAAKHSSELPTLLELAGDVLDSAGPGNKLRAAGKVCEFLAPIADDFPVYAASAVGLGVDAVEVAEKQLLEAAAIDIGRLKAIWPIIQMLLPILLDRLRR